MKMYEKMSKEEFKELVFRGMELALKEKVAKGEMTPTEEGDVSFESSVYDNRIIFNPEEDRQVVVTFRTEEFICGD